MYNKLKTGFFISALFAVVACSGSAKDKLGLRRTAPDEFKVLSYAPLSVPPDFSLRPLGSGDAAAEKAAADTADSKRILQEGSSKKSSIASAKIYGTTKGESAFLNKAGTETANPDIKAVLNKDEAEIAADPEQGFLDKLKSYSEKNGKNTDTSIVNASGEKDRIAKNLAAGKSVTEGETPTVTASKKGFFQNMFGL